MNFNLLSPCDQLVEVISLIYKNKMTTISGGNLSIKDENGGIWITPAAIDKGNLKPTDIMHVMKNGVIAGPHRPSSEYPFHKSIYEKRPDIKAIIHAHPPALVSWSIIKKVPNIDLIPRFKEFCGEIGFAEYALPGSQKLGDKISGTFDKGFSAVLLENHGIVVGSDSLLNALHQLETLEYFSRSLIQASKLGKLKNVINEDKNKIKLRDQKIIFFKKQIEEKLIEQKINKENQIDEKVDEEICLRKNIIEENNKESKFKQGIIDIIQRSCSQQLMFGVEGIVSHRIDNESFYITPDKVDRRFMTIDDLVLVDKSNYYVRNIPNNQYLLHQQIYKAHPEINVLISTSSANVLAYSISEEKFNTRTIPESYIVLREIQKLPYSDLLLNTEKIVETISLDTPVILIENDSLLVAGKNLLEAFDRVEVAEFCAKSAIDAKSIGDVKPMGNEEIEEIKKNYL